MTAPETPEPDPDPEFVGAPVELLDEPPVALMAALMAALLVALVTALTVATTSLTEGLAVDEGTVVDESR